MEKPVDNGNIGFPASSGFPPGREQIAEMEDKLRADANAGASGFPRTESLPVVFSRIAEAHCHSVALETGATKLTYAELDAHTNRLANALRDLGLEQGGTVGIYADRSGEAVVAVLAILKAGGAYVPLDVNAPKVRTRFVLEDAAVSIVIATPDRIAELSGETSATLLPVQLDPDRTDSESLQFRCTVNPADTAYIMYTSGSTGAPKGVCVEHRNILRLVFGQRYATFGPDKTFLFHAPLSFDASTFELWGALLHGARLVVAPAGLLSLHELADVIRDHQVTTLWLTAPLFHEMVDSDALSRIGCVSELLAGGDVLSPEHVRRALKALPNTTIINGYGPTECTTFACCHRISDPSQVESPLPIGLPIAHTPVYILDEAGTQAPISTPGEICIGGDGVATGYLNRPDLTAERFVADPYSDSDHARMFRTGDRGRIRSDGLVEFLGRTDSQVKIRGFRVELDEIEAVLRQHTDVLDAAARVVDTGLDRRIIGYAIARPNTPQDSEQLLAYMRDRLPAYMVPHSIVWIAEFPLTPSGKVDRKTLPVPTPDLASDCESELKGDLEHQLATIWLRILPVDRVGPNDDFFELGGNSLLAMRLANRVRSRFGVDLPIRRVFEVSRLSEMAEWIDKEPKTASSTLTPMQPVARGEMAPLSYSQQGLYFLEQFSPGLPEYNVPVVYRLRGKIDVVALGTAFDQMVERHASLRTRFVCTNGIPQQEVLDTQTNVLRVEDVPAAEGEDAFAVCIRRVADCVDRRFNFAKGYLFDAVLFRLDATDYVLCVVFHHIVFDGWSMGVFCRELSEIYHSVLQQRTPSLEPIEFHYTDYARWQRAPQSTGTDDSSLAYWMSVLAGNLPELQFLRVTEASSDQPAMGGWVTRRIPNETVNLARECHRELNTTLFAVLLAAWKVLLFRYSGESDILVGAAFANRQHDQLDNIIGYFVNTLPIRTAITSGQTFRETVSAVHATALDAHEHQNTPFELIVDRLKPTRAAGRIPIVESIFALQNATDTRLLLTHSEGTRIDVHNKIPKFPLSLMIWEESDRGLYLDLEYSRDVLDDTMADRLITHYLNVLQSCSLRPDTPNLDVTMLTRKETELLLHTWNNTARPYPSTSSAIDVFEERVRAHFDSPAISYDQITLTYGELDARANIVAQNLKLMGLKPSSLIAIMMNRSADYVLAILGSLKAGCAYLPLDPDIPKVRNIGIIEDAKPDLVISCEASGFTDAVTERGLRTANWETIRRRAPKITEDALRECVRGDAAAYVMYTSGSSGVPKGVVVPHRAILRLVVNTNYVEFRLNCRVAQTSNMAFDASTFEIWGALLNGGCLVGVPRGILLSPVHFKAFLKSEQIDVVFLTTGLYNHIVSHESDAFAGVETVVCGGEALGSKWVRRMFESGPPLHFVNGYGPTECTTFATSHEVTRTPSIEDSIPIGRPIANTKAYVLGRHGCLLPTGIPGELYLGGDSVALGYHNDSHATAARFVPDPFDAAGMLYRTGDLVKQLHDGIIVFLGRLDSQIKIRGFRVELEEIETTARRFPAIKDAVVVATDGEGAEKQLICYFVPTEGGVLDSAPLRNFLRGCLPTYMVPSRFVLVPHLPLNANGKVDRSRLPRLTEIDGETSQVDFERGIDHERRLLGIWSRIVGHTQITSSDSFFDVGGNSLLLFRLLSQIHEEYGIDLSVRELFENPTIATQTKLLDSKRQGVDDITYHVGVTRTDYRPLLSVRSEGTFPPLFFVTGAGDVVGTYTTLVSLLNPEQPFFGFPDPLFSSMTTSDFDVERLAERYEVEIRNVQPSGPYYLGGYSFGAIVAYEMARRLTAKGERVAALVVVDTGPLVRSDTSPLRALRIAGVRLRYAFDRAIVFWRWRRVLYKDAAHLVRILRKQGLQKRQTHPNVPSAKEYVLWSLRNVAGLDRQEQNLADILESREARLEMLNQPHIRRLNQSMSYALRAYRRYQFEPYAGRVTLFRATDDPTRQDLKDESLGWRSLARGGVEIIPVPGTHNTLFIQPNVKTLAVALQSCLDAARAQFGMSASDQGVSQEELQPTEDQ